MAKDGLKMFILMCIIVLLILVFSGPLESLLRTIAGTL